MRIRLYGVVLLIVCAGALWLMRSMATPPEMNGPSLVQIVVSALAVLTGFPGGLLLFVGPSLFDPVERPNYRSPSFLLSDDQERDPGR